MEVGPFQRLIRLLRVYPVPRPTLQFLIDVPAEVAFSRKSDIPDIQFLERRIPLYHALAVNERMQCVDGTAAPDTVAATVWQHVQPLLRKQPSAMLD